MRTAAVLFVLAAAPMALAAQDRQVVQLPGAVPSGLPFSPAIRTGNILYLSGQVGIVPGTRQLAAGGVGPETRQALENIRRVLEAGGSSMQRVLKCTVFLADIADYAAMNEVYASFFPSDPPARSTVAVGGLAFGAKTEIECLATTG